MITTSKITFRIRISAGGIGIPKAIPLLELNSKCKMPFKNSIFSFPIIFIAADLEIWSEIAKIIESAEMRIHCFFMGAL